MSKTAQSKLISKEESLVFKPLYQNVVVKIDQRAQRTASGIYMPEVRHPEKFRIGTVVSTGPGKYLECGKTRPMSLSVGDRVIFNEFMGTKIKLSKFSDADVYLCMKEDDIWSTFEGDIELNEIFERS